MYDTIKRWLCYCGYTVDHVCNLTDVDDKIIAKMRAENKSLKDVTEFYTNAFFEDREVLNIIKARAYPRATEYIEEMNKMVDKLVQSKHAYEANNSVYFQASSFSDYGKLAGVKLEDAADAAVGSGYGRVLQSTRNLPPLSKRSTQDFALWKAATAQDGDVSWDSKYGRGRPGKNHILYCEGHNGICNFVY